MKQREETAGVLSFHVPLREPEKAGGEKGGRTIETMFAACPELFLTKMFAVQRMLVVQKAFVGQRGRNNGRLDSSGMAPQAMQKCPLKMEN